MTQIEVRSELKGEDRTKLNQLLNKAIDMLNANYPELKISHINVNGVIVARANFNAADIINGCFLTNAKVKKFATFHTQHEDFNMPEDEGAKAVEWIINQGVDGTRQIRKLIPEYVAPKSSTPEVHHIIDGLVFSGSLANCQAYIKAANDPSEYFISGESQ